MTAYLLDVNALIALAWSTHSEHERMQNWFSRNARQEWATCPFTECAFIRIVSNPAFSPDFLTMSEAVRLMTLNISHPTHRFWAADLPLDEAVRRFGGRLVGHQQVTDAYLLGLALHKKGRLATLDQSVVALLDPNSPERDRVEVISRNS
jgi:toxin-antitoxin system PIN domain toxin